MIPPHERAHLLCTAHHGFFGRDGGVSTGIYMSLNCGPGSSDTPEHVKENRHRVCSRLEADHLITAYQTHSASAAYINALPAETVHADALVTDTPGLAVGVLSADCVPVLFQYGSLVGAAHAGWRGSLDGILEATVSLMVEKGAKPDGISAGIGPCLRAPAFEVSEDLIDQVMHKYPEAERFFEPKKTPGKAVYDHVGFVQWRLQECGLNIDLIEDVGGCTLTSSDRWFSYRASRAKGEADYGRNISAIAAPPA